MKFKSYVVNILKVLALYKIFKLAYRRLRGIPVHPLQRLKMRKNIKISRLGSDASGWCFIDTPELVGGTIISGGLGEDASFDVEFATKYKARVIIVDPTPRAINHFESIIKNLGRAKTKQYVNTGCQPIASYELRHIVESNLQFIDKALWNKNEILKFYEPKDPSHVSHSIINFQNNYSEETVSIDVEGLTMEAVLTSCGLHPNSINLIKLDVEGAEIEVIENMLACNIRPKQILVEFDELNYPTNKAFSRVDFAHGLLIQAGYDCVYTDGQADFLYILEEVIV